MNVQELAVGPARGDDEAVARHKKGDPYNAAALVVHEPCLRDRSDAELEIFVEGLVMVPRVDRPRRVVASS